MEQKTRKVLDINAEGKRFVCILHMGTTNPYKLYQMWYDRGWKRKQIAKYANFISILNWLNNYALDYGWGFKD